MSLRVVLADDEPIARMRLRMLLAQIGGTTVVAECRNGRELIVAMEGNDLDIVFTDIEMPGMDGFQAVARLNDAEGPQIVFVTAYPQYAARAFEIQALDYLVKPIESRRLEECLRRASRVKSAPHAAATSQAGDAAEITIWQRRFFVTDGVKQFFVEANEIDWIEAADYYACLHAGSRAYLVRQTIQSLTGLLDPACFLRAHRSAIVNLDRVQQLVRDGRRGGYLVLTDQSRVPVSNSCWKGLLGAMRVR